MIMALGRGLFFCHSALTLFLLRRGNPEIAALTATAGIGCLLVGVGVIS